MVIINRNDLSIRRPARANTRVAMQDRTVSGSGAKASTAGVLSPRSFLRPGLALRASDHGLTAQGYPVQHRLAGKPEAEATALESEVPALRIDRDYPSPDRNAEPQDLATASLKVSSQWCPPAATAPK